MKIVSTPIDIFTALLIFVIGGLLLLNIGRQFKTALSHCALLYVWHTLFCFTYLWYVLNYGGDALEYYTKASTGNLKFDYGTAAVNYLTAIIVQPLALSLLGTFLVFNIFGTIGLLAFDSCLRTATQDKSKKIRRLAAWIVLLPSISFWSSAIGKDALSFMAAGLALWSALNLRRRTTVMVLAIAVMLLVRPHMAGMMVLGLTVASLLDPTAPVGKRLILGMIAAAISGTLIPFALNYAGVGEQANAEDVTDYIQSRQTYNLEGGGAVDIASMSLPEKMVTYVFRPFIFEAKNFTSLFSAIENLILVYLFYAWIRSMLRGQKITQQANRAFMWTYSIMAWTVLALTTANLGIAMRQKWMFMPMLMFLLISAIGRKKRSPADMHAGLTRISN